MFQDIIDYYDEEPVRARKGLPASDTNSLLASAYDVADKSNVYIDHEILSYIYANERYHGETEAVAFREVMNYISDAENIYSNVLTSYSELLPAGHPRRPDQQSREDLAEYLSTQAPKQVQDALIASICATPGSIDRQFNMYAIKDAGVDYSYLVDMADSLIAAGGESSPEVVEISEATMEQVMRDDELATNGYLDEMSDDDLDFEYTYMTTPNDEAELASAD